MDPDIDVEAARILGTKTMRDTVDGALGLDHDHRILVSEHLNLSEQDSSAHIRQLVGARIRRPLRRYRLPAAEHVDWHNKNLFKHPAR